MADTRPSSSLSLQPLLQQLRWQNHLVCDQRGLGSAPLISPRPGELSRLRALGAQWGRRGRPEGVRTDTPWEWREGLETCQERGLRLETGRRGTVVRPYGSLTPLVPPPAWAQAAVGPGTPLLWALVCSAAKWESKQWW